MYHYNSRNRKKSVNKKSQKQLYEESLRLKCSTTPFSTESIKNLNVIVDTREPVELADELNKSDLTVSVGHLICGDVLITDINDPRRQLVFERKRITDFTQSIIGDDRRAYNKSKNNMHFSRSIGE